MITPAISVLSAVRVSGRDSGLRALRPADHDAILVALFIVQRQGTARVGAIFGPIMWSGS